MVKKIFMSGCLVFLLNLPFAYALPSYSNGIYLEGLVVQSVSEHLVTLVYKTSARHMFSIAPTVKVQDVTHGTTRAIRLSDIRVGDQVSVRAMGTTIFEIYKVEASR